ncbi:mitochondrial 37S ribosomal protein mS45 KNAG_0E03720 [Huiozyma naganishii CBS 8797]|uniref:37S ribosomal protein S35, mitochondrial n=1 Tax=Huiozyma naganishii (strain ATCC MYA-139 / BCRC 22969 / CBS 8797 / KCTC 17520 / NBRC 10181 / NCYC 3082 / Yp74L-3) TaxID=1071383 RepID=J7S6W6_HUIN7|nr:hypothetical protein KNAG_0E03720 [Kazachstania naganishii CBS 8797]CCK70629.1 hypothetical protein KNAG_0E03720 [Kazachstania naganishii CBS 8797]
MLGRGSCGQSGPWAVCVRVSVRWVSRRRIAYPGYPFRRLAREPSKAHDTNLKAAMREFLGPRNYRGEYALNKYSGFPMGNKPLYVQPGRERGVVLRNPLTGTPLRENQRGQLEETKVEEGSRGGGGRDAGLRPFPANKFCRTNLMVPESLKRELFEEIEVRGVSTQDVAQRHGLKVPRVEALVKLYRLEMQLPSHKKRSGDLNKFSQAMEAYFPLFRGDGGGPRENLTEIPTPARAKQSRFATIAESEPFGPLDAAAILELEPAEVTLQRLSTQGEHSSSSAQSSRRTQRVVLGELQLHERSRFQFKDVPASRVAHRYGSGNRDNKRDRAIGFDTQGHMVYL